MFTREEKRMLLNALNLAITSLNRARGKVLPLAQEAYRKEAEDMRALLVKVDNVKEVVK